MSFSTWCIYKRDFRTLTCVNNSLMMVKICCHAHKDMESQYRSYQRWECRVTEVRMRCMAKPWPRGRSSHHAYRMACREVATPSQQETGREWKKMSGSLDSSSCFDGDASCPDEISECFKRENSECGGVSKPYNSHLIEGEASRKSGRNTCLIQDSCNAVIIHVLEWPASTCFFSDTQIDTTTRVQHGWCCAQSLCSLWWGHFNAGKITAVRCVSWISFLQKAGFLYVEESFSKSDRVFRRRVVLAVCKAILTLVTVSVQTFSLAVVRVGR